METVKNPWGKLENQQRAQGVSWRLRLDRMLSDFAGEAFLALCHKDNFCRRLYWILRPAVSDGAWGKLAILKDGEDLPAGWQYAMSGPLPCNFTRDQLSMYISANSRRLPIIGAD